MTIGCFEDGIDYHWGDLDGRAVKIVSSSEECQKECQSNVDCNHWTWITPDSQEVKKFCYLKTRVGRRHPQSDGRQTISGPKYCPG